MLEYDESLSSVKWIISDHKRRKIEMSYTKNKFEDFCEKIKNRYPNEDLTVLQYTSAKEPGIIRCNKCGSIYKLKNASNFLEKSKKKICSKCFPREDTMEVGHKIEYLLKNTPNLTLLNEYTKITDDLILQCNKCQGIFKRKPQLLLKTHKCPMCESFSKRKTQESFENQLKEKFKGEYSLIGEYKGTDVTTLFRHNDCGFIFNTKPCYILTKQPCPKCKRFNSKGEIKIEKVLQEHKIIFEKQKRFVELSSLLSFDFYLPNNNLLIEFQGLQHFQPIEHFGGEERFKKQMENDNKKRLFCKNNSYQLLEIKYDQIDNIENILSFLWLND